MPGNITSRTTTEWRLERAFSRPAGPSCADSRLSCSLCRYSSSNLLNSVSSSMSRTDAITLNDKPSILHAGVKKCQGPFPAKLTTRNLLSRDRRVISKVTGPRCERSLLVASSRGRRRTASGTRDCRTNCKRSFGVEESIFCATRQPGFFQKHAQTLGVSLLQSLPPRLGRQKMPPVFCLSSQLLATSCWLKARGQSLVAASCCHTRRS